MEHVDVRPAGVDDVRRAIDGGYAVQMVVERFEAGRGDQAAGMRDSDRFGSDPAYWLGWTEAEAEAEAATDRTALPCERCWVEGQSLLECRCSETANV